MFEEAKQQLDYHNANIMTFRIGDDVVCIARGDAGRRLSDAAHAIGGDPACQTGAEIEPNFGV